MERFIVWLAFFVFIVGGIGLFLVYEGLVPKSLEFDASGLIVQQSATPVYFSGIVQYTSFNASTGKASLWVETSCDVHVNYFEELPISIGDFVTVTGVVEGDKFVRAYSVE